MSMIRRHWPGLAAALVLLLAAGCAQVATYNASYHGVPSTSPADKLPGKVLILTSRADDETPFVGRPTSFTGGGTTLSIPLGLIAREISATVFGDLFRDGAVKASSIADAPPVRVAVTPRVTQFSYEYNQLKNLGFAVTPAVTLTLEVTILDRTGKAVRTRSYESGTVEMPAYFISGSPGEEIGKAAHKAVYELMLKGATDLRQDLVTASGGGLDL